MAIRLIEEYPNRVGAPTADYPHGVPRNKSTPTATDGTPFEQSWFRDQEGFFQGLMETAGITPSGQPDTVLNSDYLDALNRVTNGVIEVDMAGAADVSLSAYQGRVAALKLTGALAADVDLIVPDTERMYWIIDETTGDFSVTVKTAAGAGVKLFGEASAVRSDGTNVVPFVNGMDRRVIYVDALSGLQALPTSTLTSGQAARISDTGRAGDFVWRTGDQSSSVSADTFSGIWVAPDDDPTGASGAWERYVEGSASIEWYGAVGDGATECSANIQAALDAHQDVFAPVGDYLIDTTLNVRPKSVFRMLAGLGNLATATPPTRIVKAATMTTTAILVETRGLLTGGCVFGEAGNAGDGVKLGGNHAKMVWTHVYNCGGVGVRVGYDGQYVNCNSFSMEHVKSYGNGSHGIYCHDGYSAINSSSDTNAGILYFCQADQNGGDGIRLGRTWWTTVINPLTQGNGGWGMNVSSAVVSPDTVPECRYVSIFGGDYNEGNTQGSLNFSGYAGCLYLASANQAVDKGGVDNNFYGTSTNTEIGQIKLTAPAAGNPALLASSNQESAWTAATFSNKANPVNGRGVGVLLSASLDRESAKIVSVQQTTDTDKLDFYIRKSGVIESMLSLRPVEPAVTPGSSDNTYSLGWSNKRWAQVFAANGTINTSDMREKEQQRALTAAETLVAKRLKGLLKAFKWKDAVEEKGADGARWHFGVMAQEVAEAFAEHGLNAHDYGLFCYDEWDAEDAVIEEWDAEYDVEGKLIKEAGSKVAQEAKPAGNRYGVRYEELIAFIVSAM